MRPGSRLTDTLVRVPRADGLQPLQRRGERGARDLSMWRLRLAPSASASYASDEEESVVVLLEGRAVAAAGDQVWTVSRSGVFDERAVALYLPPGVELVVDAQTPIEAMIVSTPAPGGGTPVLVEPTDVEVNQRGKAEYAREVHDIFVRDPYARRLMVGETFTPAGHWSSFPPHKHDGRDGEPRLEEIYYYRVDPPRGFAQQTLYTQDGEAVSHVIRDGDVVLLPYGYHPVSTPPGYRLYYLWAMAGDERRWAVYEDPAHRWIVEEPS